MFPFEALAPENAIGIFVALISILFSPEDLGMKAVWFIFVFLAPLIGALAWFLVGYSHSRRHAR